MNPGSRERLERERKLDAAVHEPNEVDDGEPAGPVDPYAPDRLDPSMIRTAIDSVRSQVLDCRIPGIAGQVTVRIRVAADGHVRSVVIERTPDAALGGCVATAVSTATFSPTHEGGSFKYPFVF